MIISFILITCIYTVLLGEVTVDALRSLQGYKGLVDSRLTELAVYIIAKCLPKYCKNIRKLYFIVKVHVCALIVECHIKTTEI